MCFQIYKTPNDQSARIETKRPATNDEQRNKINFYYILKLCNCIYGMDGRSKKCVLHIQKRDKKYYFIQFLFCFVLFSFIWMLLLNINTYTMIVQTNTMNNLRFYTCWTEIVCHIISSSAQIMYVFLFILFSYCLYTEQMLINISECFSYFQRPSNCNHRIYCKLNKLPQKRKKKNERRRNSIKFSRLMQLIWSHIIQSLIIFLISLNINEKKTHSVLVMKSSRKLK